MGQADAYPATIAFGRGLLGEALRIIEAEYGPAKYARAVVEDGIGDVAVAYVGGEPAAALVFYEIKLAAPLCVHYYVAVSSKFRRRGLAKLLITSAEARCRAPAYAATTEEDNTAALALFAGLGYRAYRWRELDRRTRVVLLKATCGYDDDVILIKGISPRELAADEGDAEEFNRRECYLVWLGVRR
jgi:GNAT superfamily N-acetyltransferase